MANFTYKKTTQTSMKIAGIININEMTVDIDGDKKSLSTLLKDFDESNVEINVKIKNEEELDEPTTEFDED